MSATVVKPFGFATGDWEGSRCGIRTRIALQNPVAQVVVAILWSHGPFATPGQGGCSLGMHGSPPKRRDKKARRSAAGRPSRRFGPPRRSWGLTRGLTHCVRSRLRRELYHPQRSSETLRLACKIAPICLIPLRLRAMPPGRLRRKRRNPHPAGRHNNRVSPCGRVRRLRGAVVGGTFGGSIDGYDQDFGVASWDGQTSLQASPLSTGHHSTRHLALCQVHSELSVCGGSTCGAEARCFLRERTALGP